MVKSDKVKARTFTLSDIKEGSSYEFRVSAVNNAGQGPASNSSVKYGGSHVRRHNFSFGGGGAQKVRVCTFSKKMTTFSRRCPENCPSNGGPYFSNL